MITWLNVTGGTLKMGLSFEQIEKLGLLREHTGFPFYREMPGPTVQVMDFRLAATPVTNAEYFEFVRAGGYTEQRYWGALVRSELPNTEALLEKRFVDQTGKPGPLTWSNGQPPPGRDDHPVSGVSWFEARAYCLFARARLPSEAEWEFAARGTEGRLYPWGNEWDEKRVPRGSTSSVNDFAQGQSACGALHLVGNVAHWVDDRFERYQGSIEYSFGRFDRVLKGDFYKGSAVSLRASVRTPRDPLDRFAGLGFRCAT